MIPLPEEARTGPGVYEISMFQARMEEAFREGRAVGESLCIRGSFVPSNDPFLTARAARPVLQKFEVSFTSEPEAWQEVWATDSVTAAAKMVHDFCSNGGTFNSGIEHCFVRALVEVDIHEDGICIARPHLIALHHDRKQGTE